MVKPGKRKFIVPLAFVAALVLLNIIAQYVYTRIDFTKEKRFTLTGQSKSVLKSLDKEIVITVFLDGDLPAAFKRLRNATKDLLADYKAYSDVPFKVVFVDPIAGLSAGDQDTAHRRISLNHCTSLRRPSSKETAGA